MKLLGRLLVRKGKTAGVFVPYGPNALPSGIYEVHEVLGELALIKLAGTPAMPDARCQALSVPELLREPWAMMTQEEVERLEKE